MLCFHVCILVAPKVVNFAHNQMITGIKGTSIVLRFQILNANPMVPANQIEWYYNDTLAIRNLSSLNGIEISFSPDYTTLTLINIDYVMKGKYSLSAANVAGEDMDYINVRIEGKFKSHYTEMLNAFMQISPNTSVHCM